MIMKKKLIALFFAGTLAAAGTDAFAGGNSIAALKMASSGIEKEKDQFAVQSALATFEGVTQMGAYFERSYGVAIFPTIGKGGLGVGGAHGKGWVFREGNLAGEASMTQLTIGFQAGGQAFSQVIFFEDEASYLNFTSGNFEFGAQASAVAINAGANASASTAGGANAGAGTAQAKDDYTGGMAVFTIAKGGLMYEAALGGQKFNFKPQR
jgi:lipid-binding SYLF domain-containing protein